MGTHGFTHAALVVNTRSRGGERAYEHAKETLLGSGIPIKSAYSITDPGRIPETVHEVLADGCDLLILGAGDGTVSAVVDMLAHHEAVLGLLPLGTANDFARTMEIPGDLRGACDAIASGKVVDVDLGLVGDNYFVNVVSAGLSVGVTHALSPGLKKRAGRFAYPLASVKAFLTHKPFTARLSFPDGDRSELELDRVLQVAVGNGRFYGGGNLISPDAHIDDHALDAYVIQLGRHRDLAGVARYFRSGDFIQQDNVTQLTTQRMVVTTDPPLPLNVDGEIVAHAPQEITMARNALKVLVPEHSNAATFEG